MPCRFNARHSGQKISLRNLGRAAPVVPESVTYAALQHESIDAASGSAVTCTMQNHPTLVSSIGAQEPTPVQAPAQASPQAPITPPGRPSRRVVVVVQGQGGAGKSSLASTSSCASVRLDPLGRLDRERRTPENRSLGNVERRDATRPRTQLPGASVARERRTPHPGATGNIEPRDATRPGT